MLSFTDTVEGPITIHYAAFVKDPSWDIEVGKRADGNGFNETSTEYFLPTIAEIKTLKRIDDNLETARPNLAKLLAEVKNAGWVGTNVQDNLTRTYTSDSFGVPLNDYQGYYDGFQLYFSSNKNGDVASLSLIIGNDFLNYWPTESSPWTLQVGNNPQQSFKTILKADSTNNGVTADTVKSYLLEQGFVQESRGLSTAYQTSEQKWFYYDDQESSYSIEVGKNAADPNSVNLIRIFKNSDEVTTYKNEGGEGATNFTTNQLAYISYGTVNIFYPLTATSQILLSAATSSQGSTQSKTSAGINSSGLNMPQIRQGNYSSAAGIYLGGFDGTDKLVVSSNGNVVWTYNKAGNTQSFNLSNPTANGSKLLISFHPKGEVASASTGSSDSSKDRIEISGGQSQMFARQ